MMDIIIAGLGNPDTKYSRNRHNAGFMVIERIAEKTGIELNSSKFKSKYGSGFVKGKKLHLLKPMTYMNRSGEAISKASNFFKIPAENIVVIHDDMDIPLGRIKLKSGGGTAGHNGLRSIVERTGESGFARVRFGIGKPLNGSDVVSYVLSDFSNEEWELVEESIETCSQAAMEIIENGLHAAMNKYNKNSE